MENKIPSFNEAKEISSIFNFFVDFGSNCVKIDFFSSVGKENAKITLSRVSEEDSEIIVDYNILIKKIV